MTENRSHRSTKASFDPPGGWADFLTSAGQIRLAGLACLPDRFRLLTAANAAEPGYVSAEQAVLSGRPYFGIAHPWLWVVDVDCDTDHHPSVLASLHVLLDDAGCDERFEVRSGSAGHVHVYVYEPVMERRRRIARTFGGQGIDFRLQESGSPIRPPGAPHRDGNHWAEPVDGWADAEAILAQWAARHDLECRPAVVGSLDDLSARDRALLASNWAEADRLGPPTPRRGAHVDRSAVDVALAGAFRHAGLVLSDFVTVRCSGEFSSPKAAEQSDPGAYLARQWHASISYGGVWRAGLSTLPAFYGRFVIDNEAGLRPSPRKLLAVMLTRAAQIERTVFDWSRRSIAEAADMDTTTVRRALDALRDAELIRSRSGSSGDGEADQYTVATETLNCHPQSATPDRMWGDFAGSVPDVCHPAFSRGALTSTGWAVLVSFSSARSQAEALVRSAVSENTFRDYRKRLVEMGAVVPVDSSKRPRYVMTDGFDWDRWSDEHGHSRRTEERMAKRARRHIEEQKRRTQDLLRHHRIDAQEAVDRFADLAQRRRQIERKRSDELVAVSESDARVGHCRACGRWTTESSGDLGVPLHGGCRFPAWLAQIERANGVPIPDELVRPTAPPDWGEFADLAELPGAFGPARVELVAA